MKHFVFRDGAFEWVDAVMPGDVDCTDMDAEEAQRLVDDWLNADRETEAR